MILLFRSPHGFAFVVGIRELRRVLLQRLLERECLADGRVRREVREGAVSLFDNLVEQLNGSAAAFWQGHAELPQVEAGVARESSPWLEVGAAHQADECWWRRYKGRQDDSRKWANFCFFKKTRQDPLNKKCKKRNYLSITMTFANTSYK